MGCVCALLDMFLCENEQYDPLHCKSDGGIILLADRGSDGILRGA